MDRNHTPAHEPSSAETLALLNGPTSSADSITQSNSHGQPLARQKRRRTSPQDQAILEAAYHHDSKPDKAARLELVKQTSLGEKEVQIWYQNRRQSSRRKSRPLLPHEIAQYRMARAAVSSDALSPDNETQDGIRSQSGVHRDAEGSPNYSNASSDWADSGELTHGTEARLCRTPTTTSAGQGPNQAGAASDVWTEPSQVQNSVASHRTSSTPAHDSSPAIGYLANRRRRSLLSPSLFSASVPPQRRERQLRKSSSFVRLSMDLDGNAVVTTKDASSPSPPRPQQFVVPGAPSSLAIAPRLPPISSLKRSLSARSRDSQSWEFWCDQQSRNELETAASEDAKGTAAAAIGLLRTTSGRNILGSLSYKPCSHRSDDAKRPKHDHKKSSFQRSSSPFGRLQNTKAPSMSAPVRPKHSESAASYLKATDSDKENWSPLGGEGLGLRETGRDPHAGSQARMQSTDPEADPQPADLMGGGKKSATGSQADDLDCVQGLMSLSQGNWR